jgi:hypothetical protein
MPNKEANRIKFFSKADGASGHCLVLAEPILRNFDKEKSIDDINDIIELYQIKRYIDADLFLPRWTESDRDYFKEVVKELWNTIRKYCITIDDCNFRKLFNTLEFSYRDSFWDLIETFEIYKKISKEIFVKVLNSKHIFLRDVLHHKKLVKYYGQEIKQHMLENEKSAELLLAQYEEKHERNYTDINFPGFLTLEDREQIILNYLNWEDANLNYIRLIVNSRDTEKIKLSDKTRLKAYRVEREKNNEILETGHVWSCGNQVSLSEKQEEPVLITWEDNIQKVSYSTKWLDQFDDSFSLFQIFSNLFWFTDEFGLVELVSKKEEMDVMEKVLMTSKNSYSQGIAFTRKSNLSHIQIFMFAEYLKGRNKTIELILKDVIDGIFNGFFGLKNLLITFPSENTSKLEKVRMIAPEFESLLKQFQLFAEDGIIDHELLRISSTPKKISDIKSLVDKKYGYGTASQELQLLQHSFFSDQSMLWYVDQNKDKYHDLYSLLVKEDVRLTDFKNYQRPAIEKFITDGYLTENQDGFVKILKALELFVIGKLYKDEVISYWLFPSVIRTVIDQMHDVGLIRFGKTLFSEPEQKYFNYYLNKSDFTDGLDLRNRYLHGTNCDSDEEHQNSYLIYLKLFILALLKIVNDLAIDVTKKKNECK